MKQDKPNIVFIVGDNVGWTNQVLVRHYGKQAEPAGACCGRTSTIWRFAST